MKEPLYRSRFMGERVTKTLRAVGIPVEWLTDKGSPRGSRQAGDGVKVVTFHSSKRLEFPVVAIPGFGYLPYEQEDEQEEIRLAYVAMTSPDFSPDTGALA